MFEVSVNGIYGGRMIHLYYSGAIFIFMFIVTLSYNRRERINKRLIKSIQKELAKEKEKLRLLNKMHPARRNEEGYTFYYRPENNEVWKGNKHVNESVCRLMRLFDDDDNYYGNRIANLLNGEYVVDAPDKESDLIKNTK